jgi:hypothetical protein
MSTDSDGAGSTREVLTDLEALTEAARVIFGFSSREEMLALFKRKLVRHAVANLEKALELTRARRQPDEFALALAIDMEVLKQARERGYDLESLFNDPNHHSPPTEEIASLIASLWSSE